MDCRDSSAVLPKCIVMDNGFDWQGDAAPDIPLRRADHLRSAREGLYRPSIIGGAASRHLSRLHREDTLSAELGINAVEFMPLQEFYVEDFLAGAGPHQLLGLQHHRLFRARILLRHAERPRLPGRASSRLWCANCTGRASRSSWTWCTTTPARATSWARRSASGASTTRPTTALTGLPR